MKNIEFTKMVASGNDFVLVDNRTLKLKPTGGLPEFAKAACARRFSIGADGLLLLEKSNKADITMRIFNPDGSEVTMCGNGSRCAAYYAAVKKITGATLTIETKAGTLKAEVNTKKSTAKIEMTQPVSLKNRFALEAGGGSIEVGFVNTGVPHAVHFVDDLESVDVKTLGSRIRFHERFRPEGTNADFVKVIDSNNIAIRTYERGVEDETLACGTGAVASAIIGSEEGYVKPPVKVKTKGGEFLLIDFKKSGGEYTNVFLEGKVKLVYAGRLEV